ncbi:hypothetical protein [Cohnella kolymensis]|uniref:hypothetical protein n=1 Tax=Cohnella kolymensis TaxID=1590652 RepID=UPI000A468185|nr:hypothetical protein [Cohnella kolymensis]
MAQSFDDIPSVQEREFELWPPFLSGRDIDKRGGKQLHLSERDIDKRAENNYT